MTVNRSLYCVKPFMGLQFNLFHFEIECPFPHLLSYLHNDLSCRKVPFYTLMYCKVLYVQITICVLSSQISFWLAFCFKYVPYILNVALPLAIRSTAEWAEMLAVTYLSVSRVYAGKDIWTCKYLIYSNQANFLTEFFIVSL
jgi:hypothetical protein